MDRFDKHSVRCADAQLVMCCVNTMAAPPDLENLLKDVKLTVGEGVRVVTEDEMKAMMKEGQPVKGEPDFISNNGRIEPADKWAQTTPEKLATTPDNLTAGDQKYYVLAYTLPGIEIGEQARSEQLSVKISGFFSDIDSGKRHIKKLHRLVPENDLTLEKLNEWTAVSEGTVLGTESRMVALKGIMSEYHTTEHEYRQKQLERMQAVSQASSRQRRSGADTRGLQGHSHRNQLRGDGPRQRRPTPVGGPPHHTIRNGMRRSELRRRRAGFGFRQKGAAHAAGNRQWTGMVRD